MDRPISCDLTASVRSRAKWWFVARQVNDTTGVSPKPDDENE
jgi:hypothetical protein